MANFYTRFSFGISTNTSAEKDFLLNMGRFIEDVVDEPVGDRPSYSLGDFDLELTPAEERMLLAFTATGISVEEIQHLDLPAVVVFADEDGNVEAAAAIVSMFLNRFALDKCVTFTWSKSCDAPRINEFGGGACIVSAIGTKYVTTDELVDKLLLEYNASADSVRNYGG